MAINKIGPGQVMRVQVEDGSVWKDIAADCLRIYEPSPILKMIERDIEEAKAKMNIPMPKEREP